MPTQAIRGVELVTTGSWAASTGQATITRGELEAMLEAGRDQLLDRAPIKLGHRSALNDPVGDGEPAYGWVIPTRVGPSTSQPGETSLYGDLVGIPGKLAAAIPTAYRRRSVEVAYAVKARSGKAYAAVLTAIALLGITKPAVKGLADVVALYGADGVTTDHVDRLEVVDGLEASPGLVAMLAEARNAGVDLAVLDRMAAAAGARDTANVPPSVDETVNDDPQSAITAPTTGVIMAGIVTEERLRELLAQEQDADVEGTLAALRTPATPADVVAPATEVETPVTPVVADVAASEAPATVTLSAGAWEDAQADLKWARDRRRADVLDGAVRTGRIAPAERASFAAQLERDEEGTTALITGLAPRFAVDSVGTDTVTPAAELAAGTTDAAWADFDRATFGIDVPVQA